MDALLMAFSLINFIGIVVLLFIVLSKKTQNTGIDPEAIGSLKEQMNQIPNVMRSNMENCLAKEMVTFQEKASRSSEANNEKLERFQNNIQGSINTRFDGLNKQIDDKLAEINRKVDEKLSEGFKGTGETMNQVRERLQAIDDAQKNIQELSKEMISIKNILDGNQSRGQYGEYQLSMVLHQVFGDTFGCYEEQYTMRKVKDGNDVRADAVVFMPEPNKMICIDSKFPFQDYAKTFDTDSEEEKEQYTRDFGAAVKKHITVIKDKYIVENKTAPEAIMFVPNDGVFAFIHHNCEDVVDYAREKRVILSSPSTLPAILVTINMVRIETERAKNVQEISNHLAKLGKDFEMFSKEWEALSTNLDRTAKAREKLDTRVSKMTNKFDAICGSSLEKMEDNTIQEDVQNDS